jgi:hypothetical protein
MNNSFYIWFDLIVVFNNAYQQYFSYIIATSLSDGRSRREPPIMGKHLVDYHLRVRVEFTFFRNLQSWAQTHAVLVIVLYQLLGNPTT